MARGFIERGMAEMAEEMGHSPTRIQLKHKDPRGWQEFMDHLRSHSAQGMSNTGTRYQAQRPSLYDFQGRVCQDDVTGAAGGSATRMRQCLDTNLMLKSVIPTAGTVDLPKHRARDQSGRAGRVQCAGGKFLQRG